MRGPASRPVVIAAGGTGGHFFPAEALASALIGRGHRVVLMTDRRSGAASSTVFASHEQHVLPGAGLAGRGAYRAGTALVGLARGTWKARRLLSSLNATVIVGFGGYPSVAPVLAASSLRHKPRVILQEQNAVLGRANRFLSRHADMLALGFPRTRQVPPGTSTVVTGNPVRLPITEIAAAPLLVDGDLFYLLILGGSLGARIFSDIVPAAVTSLQPSLRARIRVTQQCRREDLPRVQAVYANAGVPADLSPFFSDIASRLAKAHLVVARAGASTCAEISVVGRAAILVPLPSAIDGHQRANAEALAAAGGAMLCQQQDFLPDRLRAELSQALCDPRWLAAASKASAGFGRPQATRDLADAVENLLTSGVVVS